MRAHEIGEVWGASDRILVVLDPELPSEQAIRSAWRLAAGYRAELVAVAVIAPGRIAERERLAPAMRLAEDLGATVRIVEREDRIDAIAQLARAENASTVVLAYRPERGWRRRFDDRAIDRLFEMLDGVELHLVESPH
jgi:two-component system sensor histidine kinase KdpD